MFELGTWKGSTAVPIRSKLASGSFFLDSKTIYIETSAIPTDGFSRNQQLVINADGSLSERFRPESRRGLSFRFQALDNGWLLGSEYNRLTAQSDALVRAVLPDYTTTLRVPFPLALERDPWATESGPLLSDDRSRLIYSSDRWIVCRRVDNLELLWKRQIEVPLRPWLATISATGSWVAIAAIDTAYFADQRNFYVEIFDGKHGSPLARLPLNGFDGIAIAPDGDLVAVSRLTNHNDKNKVQPAVHIYEVSSGKEVATLPHDLLPVEQAFLFGSLASQFTSDRKYIVTSAIDTKIWEI